jgi:single-stranded DNA-binding protein
MNDINLLGRLTNTPELKQSANGRLYMVYNGRASTR